MSKFEERVTIAVPPEEVWAALADIGSIHLWNPGVVHSEKTTAGDVGVGARRRCDLGGNKYLDEEVVEFERPRILTVRITDTNLPFETADIRFAVEPHDDGAVVKVVPSYRLKFGLLGRLLDTLIVRPQYRTGMRRLLSGLKDYLERRQPRRS